MQRFCTTHVWRLVLLVCLGFVLLESCAPDGVPGETKTGQEARSELTRNEVPSEEYQSTKETHKEVSPTDGGIRDQINPQPCLYTRVRSCQLKGVGECGKGIQVCQKNARWGECVFAGVKGKEICDGKDNDCDGKIDEDFTNEECCIPTQLQNTLVLSNTYYSAIHQSFKELALTKDGVHQTIDAKTGTRRRTVAENLKGSGYTKTYHPSKPWLAIGLTATKAKDTAILLVNTENGKLLHEYKGRVSDPRILQNHGAVNPLVFSPDGTLITAAYGTGAPEKTFQNQIVVWNVVDASIVQRINTNQAQIASLSISPDNKYLATGTWRTNEIKIWKLPQGSLAYTWSGSSRKFGSIRSIDFHPSSQTIAVASTAGTIRIWKVDSGEMLHQFYFPGGPQFDSGGYDFRNPIHVKYSPDGHWLLVVPDKRHDSNYIQKHLDGIHLLETEKYQVRHSFFRGVVDLKDITGIHWSNDSRQFAILQQGRHGQLRSFSCLK